MAGIYVHVPFCKSRCIYCGFYSTTLLKWRKAYVDAVVGELADKRDFLHGETVETIYLGGGTPTQLSPSQLRRILECIYNIYNVSPTAEVTIEANPDDVHSPLLRELRQMGVNRLSMGVQSFDDGRLRFLHRRHTARQAIEAVKAAQEAGFDNVSIDLMFGFPGQTLQEWKNDVRQALSLGVQHMSAYSLMVEEGTPLSRLLDEGWMEEPDDELARQMYEHLLDATSAAGFEHYEISNFAKPGHRSRHNSSYWHGVPYLGVGAGAHSYDGRNRFFHTDSLGDYLSGHPWQEEQLTERERYDEFVFTGLRTCDGISMTELEQRFGAQMRDYCKKNAQHHVDAGRMDFDGDVLRLTRQGLFVSNDVMSDLMWVD